MALKDWVKIENTKYSVLFSKNKHDYIINNNEFPLKERQKQLSILGHGSVKEWKNIISQNKKLGYNIGVLNKNWGVFNEKSRFALKSFKTKSQALKFAKDYMRKH